MRVKADHDDLESGQATALWVQFLITSRRLTGLIDDIS